VVGTTQRDIITWAKCDKAADGSTIYNEVFLDQNKIPHLTGTAIRNTHRHHLTPAIVWLHKPKHRPEDEEEDPFDPPEHYNTQRIQGTTHSAFPLNDGWTLQGSSLTHLSQIFLIKNLTEYYTRTLIGDTHPNCELRGRMKRLFL
jgi:hypothetical protein